MGVLRIKIQIGPAIYKFEFQVLLTRTGDVVAADVAWLDASTWSKNWVRGVRAHPAFNYTLGLEYFIAELL